MKRISLDGEWQLSYLPQNTSRLKHPDDLEGIETISALVPGNVELDLMRASIIPDPFYGDNVTKLRKFESFEWWYQRSFEGPKLESGQTVELVFHGLDCLATIWLNGQLLGQTNSMLIEHRFDITELCSTSNELVIRLQSVVLEARQRRVDPCESSLSYNWEGMGIRKAPHMYGWDIAPRIVSAGIWRSVELEIHNPTEIWDLYYYTRYAYGSTAGFFAKWQFRTDRPDLDGFFLRFKGSCQGHAFEKDAPVYFATAGSCDFHLEDAKLWWPRGYGEPNLYEVTCELWYKDQLMDTRTDTIGLRKIELIRTDTTTDENPGEFLIKCNGVPIFCKGSNHVPLDAIHSRDSKRYESVLELYTDLECNIVRCWGGNVYEDHGFFDFCDRNGIMVWQDFAFACTLYPQTEDFLAQVAHEAESIIRKLRNHPSLAVWCGDNEVDVFYLYADLDPNQNRVTREVLSQAVFRCDPYRAFVPSSPYVCPQVAQTKDQSLMPEYHLWGPRDYYKSSFYTENKAHFIGEIGYHGCPNVSSIKRFIEPEYLWPYQDNPQWIVHAADPLPQGGAYKYRVKLMADQIGELFGFVPDNIEKFALASQICQAEAKKFFIEMTRLRKWRRTGIIWWNLIDCWPQFSDAVVDYYLGKKLAYWYIKRVQNPVCLMMDEPESWHCRVIMGNDSLDPAKGTFQVRDLTKGTLLEGDYYVAPNENACVGEVRVSRGEHRLFLLEWTVGGKHYGNHYTLGTPPFSFEEYRNWLQAIASLPNGFDPKAVAR